jgi:hypothetical protein
MIGRASGQSDPSTAVALTRFAAVVCTCLLLATCAPTRGAGWVKAGADEAATAHEAGSCQAQADAALANERGINQDISATLGGNWQRARTTDVVDQSMRSDAADYATKVFDSCMRAKGFKKAG